MIKRQDMEKLSDRMTKIILDFIKIEHEFKEQNAKPRLGDVFFDHGSFQVETPGDPDGTFVEVLSILETVYDLIEEHENDQKKTTQRNNR